MKSILSAIAAVSLMAVPAGAPAFAKKDKGAKSTAPAVIGQATRVEGTVQGPMQVGDFVSDPQDNPVGMIIAIEDGYATIKTDKHEIPLPLESYGPGDGKFHVGLSQAELNAAYERQLNAATNSIEVGKEIASVEGDVIGVIELMDEETLTIRLNSDKVVRVPLSGVQEAAPVAIALYPGADLEAAGVEMPPMGDGAQ